MAVLTASQIAVLGLVGWQGATQLAAGVERMRAYDAARSAADARGKSLLVVGCPGAMQRHPCGDTCLDISGDKLRWCRSPNPTVGDVRQMPFATKQFGAVLASHILEHMETVAAAQQALSELYRVADEVFVVYPSRADIVAWLHPMHHLWVGREADGTITFEQRGN